MIVKISSELMSMVLNEDKTEFHVWYKNIEEILEGIIINGLSDKEKK